MSQTVSMRPTVRKPLRSPDVSVGPNVGKRHLVRRAVLRTVRQHGLSLAVGGLALTQLCACAGKPEPMPQADNRPGLRMNPPVVISGSPERDAAAFNAADEELSDADWQVLEQIGPKPMWQQLTGCRSRRPRPQPQGNKRFAVSPRDNTVRAAGQAPAAAGPSVSSAGNGEGPTTQPAAQTAAAAEQPTTAPAVAAPVPEEELPVQVVDLPGDKLRMIWTLRSYGGAGVTTKRDGGTTRREVTVAAPDLAPLVNVLTAALGQGANVTPLPKENTLVITCDKAMRRPTIDLLAKLDVPQRQVEITAKIFEVSQDFDFQQGAQVVLNRLADDGTQTLISSFSAKRFLDSMAGGAGGPVQGSVLSLMQNFADAGVSVDVSFQLLAESGLIKVVSEPRMTVAVGQTGYLLAGQELPIQSANIVNNVLQTLTTYKPVGVQLYITPQAASDNRVKLHTISIVSSISGFSTLPTIEGHNNPRTLVNPIIDSREAETQVTIGNGDTLVISGLRMIRTTTREEKVPGLGDIPVLGWAFKNHRSQQQLTDLYFFVTPQLLSTEPVASAL